MAYALPGPAAREVVRQRALGKSNRRFLSKRRRSNGIMKREANHA
jgi:hypothetical protein